jgi:GxxExxY protein
VQHCNGESADFLDFLCGPAVADHWCMLVDEPFNGVTSEIIGAGIEVHRNLGPGLLESTCLPCLEYEMTARGLTYVKQKLVPIEYKTVRLDGAYRIDLLVENQVIVELKSVEHLLPVHDSQVLTYLHLTGCPVGLLMNFNVPRLTQGIRRLLNTRLK